MNAAALSADCVSGIKDRYVSAAYVGCVLSQGSVSSTCRMLGQASREAARSTRTHSKIQDSKESQGYRKPPSERPRKKNKTSREVGKYQETSATSYRNRRASPRSKQTGADKA